MITRGLNSGQKYYYVVRAVASDGTYADSDEDSCTTSANVIPWNGTAAQIVQQAYNIALSTLNGGYDFDYGNLRVMAPDRSIYVNGNPNPLPPDGTVDAANNTMTIGGVTTAGPLIDPAAALFAGGPGQGGGGIRRVCAKLKTSNGQAITGMYGQYYLQDGTNSVQVPRSGAGQNNVGSH